MAEVSGSRLRLNDTLANKEVLAIRIAEEAILANTNITMIRSEASQIVLWVLNSLPKPTRIYAVGGL